MASVKVFEMGVTIPNFFRCSDVFLIGLSRLFGSLDVSQ